MDLKNQNVIDENIEAPVTELRPKTVDGEEINKNKCNSRKKIVCDCLREYSSSSTVHGVQYLGEPNRPIWERLFWIFVFTLSIYTCITTIYQLWKKWDESPVIVSFNERETEIWKIPFPAVTICPETKSDKSVFSFENAFSKFVNAEENLTEAEQKYFIAMNNICDLKIPLEEKHTQKLKVVKDFDAAETLYDLIEPELNAPYACKWIESVKCDSIMDIILTEEGFCYSFNVLSPEDMYNENYGPYYISNEEFGKLNWNREDGYAPNAGKMAYPRRILGAGKKMGLTLTLIMEQGNVDRICSESAQGFKVLIHSPDNVPKVSSKHFRVAPNQDLVAAVMPDMITTSPDLKSYSPEKRQCYFSNERQLKFFKVYTQSNCNLECLTNYTRKYCNCTKFSMPRDNGTNECETLDEQQCYNDAELIYLTQQFEFEVSDGDKSVHSEACGCLPSCTSVEYMVETSQADFHAMDTMISVYFGKNDSAEVEEIRNKYFTSRITIFFKESSFLTSKRAELYGVSEFIANCGGLLGLFMGVSTLSFVEIFYFSTIRVLTNYLRSKRR